MLISSGVQSPSRSYSGFLYRQRPGYLLWISICIPTCRFIDGYQCHGGESRSDFISSSTLDTREKSVLLPSTDTEWSCETQKIHQIKNSFLSTTSIQYQGDNWMMRFKKIINLSIYLPVTVSQGHKDDVLELNWRIRTHCFPLVLRLEIGKKA